MDRFIFIVWLWPTQTVLDLLISSIIDSMCHCLLFISEQSKIQTKVWRFKCNENLSKTYQHVKAWSCWMDKPRRVFSYGSRHHKGSIISWSQGNSVNMKNESCLQKLSLDQLPLWCLNSLPWFPWEHHASVRSVNWMDFLIWALHLVGYVSTSSLRSYCVDGLWTGLS